MDKIKVFTFDNAKELVKEDKDIKYEKVECVRFSSGEGKTIIKEIIDNEKVYMLVDVLNSSNYYEFKGKRYYITPDENFQDIKRAISSLNGRYSNITLIMPFLYESRQHRRRLGESMDCAIALQELEFAGVNNIITFDAHDPNVSNSIPHLTFENLFITNLFIKKLIEDKVDLNNLLVVSPDIGAMHRARYFAELLGCDVGVFYKRRDLTKVVDGKNPIVEHMYIGPDVKNKDIIIIDDMIASGASVFDVCGELQKKNVSNIYVAATFALFTNGLDVFREAYKKQLFNKIYTSNLTHIDDIEKDDNWLSVLDCSDFIVDVIKNHFQNNLHSFISKQEKEIIDAIRKYKGD